MFQAVRGTRDLIGAEARAQSDIIDLAYRISTLYGFDLIQTPIFEFSGVFRSLGDTSDIVTKETYDLQDRNGENLTLRPEATAGVMRAIVSNGLAHQTPLKLFTSGPMFRYDRPQKGRYRQFTQVSVELVGVEQPQADVEVISMAAHILKELGLSDKVRLEINSLGDKESRDLYRSKVVEYLKKYESDLSEDSQVRLSKNPLRILDSKDEKDREIVANAPSYQDALNATSKAFFEDVLKGLDHLGIAYRVNDKLVRGLDYYCHTAFEFVTTELGAQGTVLGGGRYNGLIKALGGPDLPGIGWAAGVDRLALLCNLPQLQVVPVVFIPLGERAEIECLKLCQELRQHGIAADTGYSGNMSKRLKRADKMHARYAVIAGEDELEKGSVLVRDLKTGEQEAVVLLNLREYLESEMEKIS